MVRNGIVLRGCELSMYVMKYIQRETVFVECTCLISNQKKEIIWRWSVSIFFLFLSSTSSFSGGCLIFKGRAMVLFENVFQSKMIYFRIEVLRFFHNPPDTKRRWIKPTLIFFNFVKMECHNFFYVPPRNLCFINWFFLFCYATSFLTW